MLIGGILIAVIGGFGGFLFIISREYVGQATGVMVVSILIGVVFIRMDASIAKEAPYKIVEQYITTKYHNTFFDRPVEVTWYEKDCSDIFILKQDYNYITVRGVK